MKEETKPMNCAQFEEILHDLDRPGTEGAALSEIALAHAESCSHCAALLTQSEWLDFALHELRAASAGKQAPARVEAALIQRFRRSKGVAARRRIEWQVGILSAAAAIILVAGVALHHRSTIPPAQAPGQQAAAPAAKEKPMGAPGTASGSAPLQATASTPSRRQERLAPSEETDSEYAADFIPLATADDSATTEGGAVVRVVLSRSALASLGLPVVDNGSGEEIPADLVVSTDGTPQAIRLVSQTNEAQPF